MLIKLYNNLGAYSDSLSLNSEFLRLNPEIGLNYHHQYQADTTLLLNDDESYAFLITENKKLIKKLGLIQEDLKVKPVKTMDMFDNPFEGVELSHFIKDMQDNKVNLHFDFNARSYSFQLLQAEEVHLLKTTLNRFFKEKKIKP